MMCHVAPKKIEVSGDFDFFSLSRRTTTNGLTNFRQLYLQNYLSEKFETLTRSVFESQLQKTLNEPYAKKSSLAAKIERTSNLCAKVRLDQIPTIISSKLFI